MSDLNEEQKEYINIDLDVDVEEDNLVCFDVVASCIEERDLGKLADIRGDDSKLEPPEPKLVAAFGIKE